MKQSLVFWLSFAKFVSGTLSYSLKVEIKESSGTRRLDLANSYLLNAVKQFYENRKGRLF